jgi:integrase
MKRKPTERCVLTERYLNALEPSDKRRTVYDKKVPNLGIRIEPRGEVIFFWFRRGQDGKAIWQRLGSWPNVTLQEVRLAATSNNKKVERWRLFPEEGSPFFKPLPMPVPEPSKTFGQAVEHYVERHLRPTAHKPQNAERELRYRINLYCKQWNDTPLHEITEQDIEDLHFTIGKKYRQQANRVIQTLRSIFAYIIRHKFWNGRDPTRTVTLFKKNKRKRYVTPKEMPQFLRALRNEPSANLRDFIWISLTTGIRTQDVLSLKWSDVNLRERTITVRDPKNNEPYEQAILREAMPSFLRRWRTRGDSVWLFPNKWGETGHIVNLRKPWGEFVKRAQMPDLHLHDVRRSYASYLGLKRYPAPIIAKALGHSDWKSAQAYVQLEVESVREAGADAVKAMIAAGRKKPIKGLLPASVKQK